MKNLKRRPFRSLIFLLFAVLISAFLLLPVSALLMAKQDAPANAEPVVQELRTTPAVPTDVFAPHSTPSPDPFGMALSPNSPIARFSNVDPMQSFVEKIRDAEDDEAKQEAIDQATAALEKHYDKYIDAYETQVDEMESRLQKLRDQLNKRKEAKDRLVGLKLEMITSQADGIGWPDATDRPNTQRFPSGTRTLWRTNPRTPASPPPNGFRPRAVPAPGAAAQPSGFFARPAAPLGTTQTAPQTATVGPTTYAMPARPSNLNVPRIDSTPTVAGTSPGPVFTTVDFGAYFETGIQLLEKEEYGEFLDRYLQPDEFRKELKSATLDEVSKKFAEESADSMLLLFRTADPVKTFDVTTKSLIWVPIKVAGEEKKLTLVRGEGDQWFLSLKDSDETVR